MTDLGVNLTTATAAATEWMDEAHRSQHTSPAGQPPGIGSAGGAVRELNTGGPAPTEPAA